MDMLQLIRIGLALLAVLVGANFLVETVKKAEAAKADVMGNYNAAEQIRTQVNSNGLVDLSKIWINGKRADQL